jgi:hypothetical protein
MNLGLALYGRSFTLANNQNTSIGAPIIEGGGEGTYRFVFCNKLILFCMFSSWSIYERRRNFSIF